MTIIFNKQSEKTKRRILRKKQTKAEEILWSYLRNKKLNGHKFKRQYSIDIYVVDFYCPEVKLSIEIDGEYHDTKSQKIYDENRKGYFTDWQITEIRFKNDEIEKNIQKVLEIINHKIIQLKKIEVKQTK